MNVDHTNTGTYAQSGENYGTTIGPGPDFFVAYAASGNPEPVMCICPNDLIMLDPGELRGIEYDFIIIDEIADIPIEFWPKLYEKKPHECPNYYPPAPMKLQYKSKPKVPVFRHEMRLDSRSGMKGITTRKRMGRI